MQFLDQLRRQSVLELLDGPLVDFGQSGPGRVIQWGAAHLFQQLANHGSDPHHLGRFVNQIGKFGAAAGPRSVGAAVLGLRLAAFLALAGQCADDDRLFGLRRLLFTHVFILPETAIRRRVDSAVSEAGAGVALPLDASGAGATVPAPERC